jgi:hypothetical protein
MDKDAYIKQLEEENTEQETDTIRICLNVYKISLGETMSLSIGEMPILIFGIRFIRANIGICRKF